MAETLLLVTQFFNGFHGTEGAKPQLFRRTQEDDGKQTKRKEKIKTFQPVSDDGYES